METPQLRITNGQNSQSKLFRQLFYLNLELENYNERNLSFKTEISDAISTNERLMEAILQNAN